MSTIGIDYLTSNVGGGNEFPYQAQLEQRKETFSSSIQNFNLHAVVDLGR